MEWLSNLSVTQPIAYAVLVLSGVATLGLALGSVKIRGLGLGVAGVLFAGILFGHFELTIDEEILHFVREFGLILFVYTIGMQVGPGFLNALRKQGLSLNLLTAAIVLVGAGLTTGLRYLFQINIAAAAGIFSGATTNTPALGAAQEALKGLSELGRNPTTLPALAYAVCYPFGIFGIILAMVLIRSVFRINPEQEAEAFAREQRANVENLTRLNIRVENTNLDGLQIQQIPGLESLRVVVSRIKPLDSSEVVPATADTVIHRGDTLLAVGTQSQLEQFRLIVGKESTEDLMRVPGLVISRRVVVTRKDVLGRTLRQLALNQLYGVSVTRLTRANVEITARPDVRLQFGDMLQIAGTEAAVTKAAEVLGNSLKELSITHLVPVFVGIALGILVGMYPIAIGDFPVPIRLGLAGGPLIVAILFSHLGKVGSLVWYMPENANLLLRELGIVLFLACVGLRSGKPFLHILLSGDGLLWMACGAVVTLIPLLLVAAIARVFMQMNYMNICGLLAGSMTDPPALAFANTLTQTDAPSIAYATVYPLTMLLRIVVAQVIVLLF